MGTLTAVSPGQWLAVEDKREGGLSRFIVTDRGAYVASVETEHAFSRSAYHPPGHAAPFNAQLIAAAPDVTLALRSLIRVLSHPGREELRDAVRPQYELAIAALKKAGEL